MKNLLKLSKTAKLLLSIGVFVVIVGSLGMTYSQQVQQQEQIDGELDIAEMRVSKLQVQGLQEKQEELQSKLDEEKAKLVEAKDYLRYSVVSADVIEEFYAIADSCDVQINNLSSSNIRQENLYGVTMAETDISAGVSGDLSDILDFVVSLNNDLTTGIVNSTQLSITETDEEEDTVSASLRLTVYSYEGN